MSSDAGQSSSRFGVTPVIALAYCAYYLSDTWGSRFETQGYGALCAAILGGLAVILILRSVLQGDIVPATLSWARDRPAALQTHVWAVVMALSLALYALAQQQLGFLLTTALMFPFLLAYLRSGSAIRIGLIGLFLTALAWLILLELLNVPLPQGPWVE